MLCFFHLWWSIAWVHKNMLVLVMNRSNLTMHNNVSCIYGLLQSIACLMTISFWYGNAFFNSPFRSNRHVRMASVQCWKCQKRLADYKSWQHLRHKINWLLFNVSCSGKTNKTKQKNLLCMPLCQHDSTKTVQTVQSHLKTVSANLLNE